MPWFVSLARWWGCLLCIASCISPAALRAETLPAASGWKAGVAKTAVTPEKPMWMSGYGGRDHVAEGKLTDLWAKVLVIEDPQGKQVAAITLDLVGIDRETSLAVRNEVCRQHGWELSQVAIFTSHTHTGPVVGRNLGAMYFLSEEQWQRVDEYTAQLKKTLVNTVAAAVADLAPCRLAWGSGETDFAVNRRENPEAEVPKLREAGQLKGPTDHSVPVLRVTNSKDDKLKAVLFGYACHATVLSFYQWSGDYPGFAQQELERRHPGAVALFWAGCGADQNPLPRRTVELAKSYGKQLADAVDQTLASPLKAIDQGAIDSAYAELKFPLAPLPSVEQLQADTQSSNRYAARRAELLLARLQQDGVLATTYPYPVQTWRLGPDLQWVILGGEVVVDYALRLKEELRPQIWVAGYANDVMAYIPSRRVLREGRYEGDASMIYYGLPTVWSPKVEDLLVDEVHQQMKKEVSGGK